MKILIITSSFPRNGQVAGKWTIDMIKELISRRCEIYVLTQNCDSKMSETELLFHNCAVTYFGWGGKKPLINMTDNLILNFPLLIKFFYSGIKTSFKIVKKWKPDIIFSEWLVPSGIIALSISIIKNIPYVSRALGSDIYLMGKKPIIKYVVRLVALKSSSLFADGFDLCEKTSKLARGKKCYFTPTCRKLDDKRSEFNPQNDTGLFKTCTIGRLHHVKGQDVLIKAANELKKKGIQFRSYIVGYGQEYNNLLEQINEFNLASEVILTGKIEDGDILCLLKHVDCVIIPSRSESIPLVLGEAVKTRNPLIVTDVGDMKYLVDRYNLGYVIPVDDYTELAKAIEKMRGNVNRSQFSENDSKVTQLLSVKNACTTIVNELKRITDH